MPKKPSPALIVALLALFVAIGGPAEAAKLISGSSIKKNTITSKQIKNRTITSGDIATKTINSLWGKASAVGSAQIVNGSVSLADMAFGSVTGNQVVDRSLTGVDVAGDSLGAGELATDSVGNAELARDAVSGNEIRTGAVTKGKIGSSDVGTEEVIDHALTGADFAKASGTATASVTVPAGGCASPLPVTAAGAAPDQLVLASAPVDGVHVDGRVASVDNLSLTVCNDNEAAAVTITAGKFPYVVLAP